MKTLLHYACNHIELEDKKLWIALPTASFRLLYMARYI